MTPNNPGRIKGALQIILAGMFGGMAPNLAGMAQNVVGNGQADSGYLVADLGMWIGTVILGLIGGGLVFFYKETHTNKAVALGAAAPALLLGMANGSPAGQERKDHQADPAAVVAEIGYVDTGRPNVVRVWNASAPAGVRLDAFQRSNSRYVHLSGLETVESSDIDLIAVIHGDGDRQHEELARHVDPDGGTVAIPSSAVEIYLRVDDMQSNRLRLSDIVSDTVTVELTVVRRGIRSGIARALGRRVSKRKIEIRFASSDGRGHPEAEEGSSRYEASRNRA